MGTVFGREPALILGLIAAAINVLLVLHVVVLEADQVAVLNIFASAVVAVITRQVVTPVVAPVLPAGTTVRVQETGVAVTV